MPSDMRAFVGAALVSLAVATSAAAQASPYLPLDDPRLPLLEHLIARGDLDDPSPMIRPFRLGDAVRVLSAADTAPGAPGGAVIHRLHESLAADLGSAEAWWGVEARVGGEAYTQKRRDPCTSADRGRPIRTATWRSGACWGRSPGPPGRRSSPA